MTTLLNFIKLIHIHPILIIFIFVSILTGTFIHLFILLAIVFIHETGHYFAAKFFKWRIHSIVLWVFGGVMKTDESGNRPIKEDIIVTVAGPLQHLFIFIMINGLSMTKLIPSPIIQSALEYNKIIFMFNLLPIFPLDGGKLFFYILSYFIPFKQAHRFTVLFSIVTSVLIILLQIFILPFTLSSLLIIVFLLLENRTEWKNHYYIFIRFLLNRLNIDRPKGKLNHLHIPSSYRLIDVFSRFRRSRTHYIYIVGENDKALTEHESLDLYFNEKKITETIGEIIGKR